jgi:hypothetical protein
MRIFLISFLLTACLSSFYLLEAQTAKKNIARRWKIDLEKLRKDTYAKLSAAEKAQAVSGKGAIAQDLKIKGSTFFEFKADGKFEAITQGNPNNFGTWQVSPDGKTLTLKTKVEGVKKYRIIQLSPSRMVLSNPGAGPKQPIEIHYIPG